jgi:hypothetical protein
VIILHAGLQHERLLLWGEVPTEEKNVPRPRGTKAAAQRALALPYDAGKTGLLTALSEIFSGLTITAEEIATTRIWLPTVD